MISAVSAGTVPEYSVVRYYMKGNSPVTGYLLQGSDSNMMLVDPLSLSLVTIDTEDFVELLATPAATACFYIGQKC